MDIDKQFPKRKLIRLPGYDYSLAGAYFVTINANNNHCLFGNISDGTMDLNLAGKIIVNSWQQLEINYPYVYLDEFCLMPNHFHGIIFIRELARPKSTSTDNLTGSSAVKIKPLGQLIGSFKTSSTKQFNLVCNTPGNIIWQRNYYDRIIRDDAELDRIRAYIMANPFRWPKEP